MKTRVQSQILIPVVSALSKITTKSGNTPMESILMQTTTDGEIILRATNGVIFASVTLPADGRLDAEPGDVLLPASRFCELTASLKGETMDIDTAEIKNDVRIDLKWKGGKGTMTAIGKPQDFPTIPEIDGNIILETNAKKLISAMNKAADACTQTGGMRPILENIRIERDGNTAVFVGSDTIVMAIAKLNEAGEGAGETMIHRNGFSAMKTFLDPNENVTIRTGERFVHVIQGKITLSILNGNGKYPAWQTILPTNNINVIETDSEPLRAGAARMAVCAEPEKKRIWTKLNGNQIELRSECAIQGTKAQETCQCEYVCGEAIETCFSASSITKALSNMNGRRVSLSIAASNRPLIIKPTGDENDIIFLVMPQIK